jgi:hypothetical protein
MLTDGALGLVAISNLGVSAQLRGVGALDPGALRAGNGYPARGAVRL